MQFLFLWNNECNIHGNHTSYNKTPSDQLRSTHSVFFTSKERGKTYFSLLLLTKIIWSFTTKHNNKEGKEKWERKILSHHDRKSSSLQTNCLVHILQKSREKLFKLNIIQTHIPIYLKEYQHFYIKFCYIILQLKL